MLVDQGGPIGAAGPTGVELRSFRSIGLRDHAIVVWATATEADVLGFYLYRALSAAGPWTPVNAALIPARGAATSGHTYALRDAQGTGTFFYRLDEVDTKGAGAPIAATEVRIGPDATGRMIFLPDLWVEPVAGPPARGIDATRSAQWAGWWRPGDGGDARRVP